MVGRTDSVPRLFGLDLLRGIAALSVMAFHLTFFRFEMTNTPILPEFVGLAHFTKYGFLGVHMFFVISGFVILMTATTADKFLVSRVVRIMPLFAVCSALSLIAISASGAGNPSFALYLSNLTLAPEAFGYAFIDGVYWTLRCEAIFYFVIFVLLSFGRLKESIFPVCVGWLAVSALYGLGVMPHIMVRPLVADYAPLFIIGVGIYLLHTTWRWNYVLLITAATAISVMNEIRHIGGNELYPPLVIGGVITALPFVLYFSILMRLPFGTFFCWVGAASYPLYLIHQSWGAAILPFSETALFTFETIFAIILAAMFLSAADEFMRPYAKRLVSSFVRRLAIF